MATEAQRRANAKYENEKVRQQRVKFYPTESDMWDHLQSQENKMGYIKQLIREDMERSAKR